MTDLAPFRERPKSLLCPRCGEMLDRAFDVVLVCLRCEGVWMPRISLEKAFGTARWPDARAMWWRNSIECPECAFTGVANMMDAAMAGSVLIDRCASHGIWLDRGELGRLMGGDTANDAGDDDLEALRARLSGGAEDLEGLIGRREAWRADLENRRRAAGEYRSWLQDEERRRHEAIEARAQAAETERLLHAAVVAEERQRHDQQRAAADARLEAAREHERARQELGDTRVDASSEVARLEAQIVTLRGKLRATEAQLDGARTRLRAIDDQLEVMHR
jgi:Zn-finger nucleic acid-binding protein